jgi:hypothetical protein
VRLGAPDLHEHAPRSGEKRHSDDWIELATTPQPLGGRRWWFVCPRTGQRVSKLYLPPSAFTFASRRAYGLAYKSQRKAPYDRAISRAFKLRHRLGATGGIGDPIDKPKWMRRRTFERLVTQVEAAEEAAEDVCDAHLAYFVGRLMSRDKRTWD